MCGHSRSFPRENPLILWLALLLVLTPGAASAATWNAASCSYADVSAQADSAQNASLADGDTVTIPACSQTNWTTQLTVTKGIILQGAGEGVTILGDNVTKNGSSTSSLMKFTVNTPHTFRITGFTLVGVATDPSIFSKGHVNLTGTSTAFRVDHITVTTPQTAFIRIVGGALLGVIDHITRTSGGPGLIFQGDQAGWAGSAYGDGSWAASLALGTVEAIFIESGTFTCGAATTNAFDADGGARVVYRYNAFTNCAVTSHGTEGQGRGRGVRSHEVYENTFTFTSGVTADFIVWFRGGTGVMFNNTITIDCCGNLNYVAKHANFRDTVSEPPWGKCDGTGPYDGNTPGETGYRCVDQPGAGTSADLGGNTTPIPTANILDPIYVWANTANGSPNNCGNLGCANDGHVHADRDIIFGTSRPGYAPFQFPHPLTVSVQTTLPGAYSLPGGLTVR